jgi:anti-sigma factor RsiW
VVLACVLTAAATVLVMSRMDGTANLEREVVAAHVRSLLQDSPIQIASSDAHTVKPWFGGRLEFAPTVKDLAAEGFPLAGGRLDYIGGRRVAALVYHRRLHVINVFLWPSASAADSAPVSVVDRGYNIVTFTRGGIVYWVISDLNMAELRLLQSLL